MSCPIKIKTLEHLKKQGALGESRIIKDVTKFNELNELLTNLASEKYNVLSPTNEKLFISKSKYVKNLDGSYRYVLRAEPNEKLFDVLQIAVDNYGILETKINIVYYCLKSIEILNSDKAKQIFEKGKKNNWSLDKILTELQIPKEQKQIVLDKYKGKVSEQEFIKSIFPDTKVKEIVYHGSKSKNKFYTAKTRQEKVWPDGSKSIKEGFYVTRHKNYAEAYSKEGHLVTAVVNVINPLKSNKPIMQGNLPKLDRNNRKSVV